ncbi:hypothetical protein D3C78_18480 [compost metagenome]
MRNNQYGQLSIEKMGWLLLGLVIMIVAGSVAASAVYRSMNKSVDSLNKETLYCPFGYEALDVRPWYPQGILMSAGKIPQITIDGRVAATEPVLDLDEGPTPSAELVCVVK